MRWLLVVTEEVTWLLQKAETRLASSAVVTSETPAAERWIGLTLLGRMTADDPMSWRREGRAPRDGLQRLSSA